MRRPRIPALTADGDGTGVRTRGSELDDGDEAVAIGPVPALRPWLLRPAERGERTPFVGGETDGDARLRIVEYAFDRRRDSLEAVHLAPRHAPAAEIALEPVEAAREGVELLGGRERFHVAEHVCVIAPLARSRRLRELVTPELRERVGDRRD